MRIVSLLPAATEWVARFGAVDDLVGRSHACDHPPEVASLPVLTCSHVDPQADSAAIEQAVQKRLRQHLSLYEVEVERLRSLRPEVVLTQAQCEVCAVPQHEVEALLADGADESPRLFSFTPSTLKQVLDDALTMGKAIGRLEEAIRWLGAAEARLAQLRAAMGLHKRTDPASLPSVVCIEWIEPLMVAGHWMPDLAEQAGARALLGAKGEPSTYVSWDAVRQADPDVLAIMPCGFTIDQTRRDLACLTQRPGWEALRAVRAGRVILFDGQAYFNRPGPRLYRAIELMAAGVHGPVAAGGVAPIQPWEMQGL